MPAFVKLSCVFVVMVLLAGCQSVPATSFDYARDTDFSRYQTFAWLDPHPLRFHEMDAHASPLLERHLKEAAIQVFPETGLRFVDDPRQADVLMAFTVGSRERILLDGYDVSAISGDETEFNYWYENSRSLGSFIEGQVCVDLFDRRSGRPIWHGTAEEALNQSEFTYWRERVPTIIRLISAGYPPSAEN